MAVSSGNVGMAYISVGGVIKAGIAIMAWRRGRAAARCQRGSGKMKNQRAALRGGMAQYQQYRWRQQ